MVLHALTAAASHNPVRLCNPVVLIGGGTSAGYSINRWVEMAPPKQYQLVVIGEESVVSYERPALSKGFLLNKSVRPPHFNTCVGGGGVSHDDTYYKENSVNFMTSTRATALNTDAKIVTLDNGEKLSYSAVVLGTGSAPNEFQGTGGDLKGVHPLYNLQDAFKLADSIESCKNKNGKAVVLGSGYIGVEVSAALVSQGITKVTVVTPDSWLMQNLLNQNIATHYEKYLEEKGIDFIFSAPYTVAMNGDDNGHVTSITLKDGTTIDADLVVVGIGSKPRTGLLHESFIAPGPPGGALVDGNFHIVRNTDHNINKRPKLQLPSADGVYAMGDIANIPLKILGGQRSRPGGVQMARESAVHCIESVVYDLTKDEDNTVSPKEEFDYLPHYYSRFFDLSWKFYGVSTGKVVVFGKLDPLILAVWINEEEKLMGIFIETRGSEEHVELLKSLVRSQPKLNCKNLEACETVDSAISLLSKMDNCVTSSKL